MGKVLKVTNPIQDMDYPYRILIGSMLYPLPVMQPSSVWVRMIGTVVYLHLHNTCSRNII